MQTDFQPVHLQQANANLDRELSSELFQKHDNAHEEGEVKNSLWKKFLGLFKSNPFELPEDLYKVK